jgi:hypothetical protein
MFVMFIGDIMASAAITLNTVPMPTTTVDFYPFEGARGTIERCEAQAFVHTAGVNLAYTSTTSLALYYLLTIWFEVREGTMTKIIEPCFHIASISTMLIPPFCFLRDELFNPIPFLKEGVSLGTDDGMVLMEGVSLDTYVGLVLKEGVSLGTDDGLVLKEGAPLGFFDGLLLKEGVSLGTDDGIVLKEGVSLGAFDGLVLKEGGSLEADDITVLVTANLRFVSGSSPY